MSTITRRYSVEVIWIVLLALLLLFLPEDARSEFPEYWALDAAGDCPDGPDSDCGF